MPEADIGAQRGPAIVVLSLVLLSGCATGGMPPSVGRTSLKSLAAASVEGSDHGLGAALLAESILSNAQSHLQVAREYVRLGIFDAALKRTERAVAREPRLAAAHELTARIWRDSGMPASALGPAHRAVAYDPRSASARNTLGTIFDVLGRDDDARRSYAGALALDPGAGWALSNLCYLEFRLGRLDEARRNCEAALRVTPTLATAQNNLALTYAASGDMTRAGEEFLAAGDEASAHYNVGIVHLARRRYAEAALAFEQAIKARPTFTAAKRWAHHAKMRALTVDDRTP